MTLDRQGTEIMACYHIVQKFVSMRTKPALKRCFKSRPTAETVRRRGATGDRADYHLDRGAPLSVVACYDVANCECAKWPKGHNAAIIAPKPRKALIMCERCNKGRRSVVEFIDPRTETPALLCRRCGERAALGYLFKGQSPKVRWLHADDPGMSMIAIPPAEQ